MNTDVYKGSIQLLEWYNSIGIKHLFLEDVEVEEIIPEIEEAVPLAPITEITSKKLIEIDEKWNEKTNLLELHAAISPCTKCKLGHTRKNFVFGSGNPHADIMFIGEAPGADEDIQGLPFVGRAGQLLTKIIEAIELSRDEVYIANIIKCRPPNNRRPEADEVSQCEPYLKKQIELVNPEFIVALGLTAVDCLFKSKHTMKDSRGKIMEYEGRKTLLTYHPAALLRNPNWKRDAWEDMKMLKKMYLEFKANQGN